VQLLKDNIVVFLCHYAHICLYMQPAPPRPEATMFECGSNLTTIANCGSLMLEYFNSIKLLRVSLREERDWIAWLRKVPT
jgi:hypothetical protein